MSKALIEKVIIWSNGMVMVFDTNGSQMPEFQGPIDEVLPKIQAVYHGPLFTGCWNCHMTSNAEAFMDVPDIKYGN